MCGICGVWGKVDSKIIENMIRVMRHRGPDDQGMFLHSHAALGMTRLSILDLSQAAHQPMSNPEQSIWIVYNGEMYNFQEERKRLEARGVRFVSTSDTEVILHLYIHYGDDFLLKLQGIFALAILDLRKGEGRERLLLARDPIGIKPLLYTRVGDRFVFASEMKAILASGLVCRNIEPDALRTLITLGSVQQPLTLVEGVRMLPPAHRLIIEGHKERIEPYWHLEVDRVKGLRSRTYDELVDDLAERLKEIVRLQMISDVPVGAFLSGGVDSTLLVGLMSQLSGSQVKTFSIGFEESDHGVDETDTARRTADYLKTDHHRVVITGNDVRNKIEHFSASIDQPSVDGLNAYFVSCAAHPDVKVAISGTGGDELFAGYPWFAQMAVSQHEMQHQSIAKRLVNRIADQPLLDHLMRRCLGSRYESNLNQASFLSVFGNTYNIFGTSGAASLIADHIAQAAQMGRPYQDDLRSIDELMWADPVNRVSALCLRGYTNNQLLRDIDAVSMAHSLEVRVPLLDISLVDFALSLPSATKMQDPLYINKISPHEATYRELGSKRILIDAGRRLNVMPPDIDMQPKRGFTMPIDSWLKGPLHEILDHSLSESTVQARGFFKPAQVSQVYNDFMENRIHWTRPWLLMMIELWSRNVLDRLY